MPNPATTITTSQGAEQGDPVIEAFSSQATTTTDRLHACQLALALEYATLRWLEENPSEVDDILEAGRGISRRIRALKRLVEIELREHCIEGSAQEVDLHGPLVRQVIALLVDKLVDVTKDVVSSEDATQVISKFTSAIEADVNVPWP